MAAIFQIRRGSGSVSLVDGELYLNTAESAFQVGTSGNPIKLLSLNTASFGDIILTGSAYISGNVVLGGTITIGDSTSDSVIFNADLSSSIIPDGTNVYDLGATNKVYRNLYATSISGAIAATNGVVSGSAQITSFGFISASASIPTGTVSSSAQITTLGFISSSSVPAGTVSGSSQLTSSYDTRYILTGSISAVPAGVVSGSSQVLITDLDGYANYNDSKMADIGEKLFTSSFNEYTTSLATTGSNSFNGNQIITGSLTISGSVIISGSVKGNIVPITIASSTASLDMNAGNYFTLTLANTTTTHIRATNITPGITATLLITTGTNSSASLAPTLLQPSGSFYTASFSSGKKDVLSLVSFDTTNMYVVSTKTME